MGNFKRFWIFGFEWWGGLKPALYWGKDGKAFVPLFLGIWVRKPHKDRSESNVGGKSYIIG